MSRRSCRCPTCRSGWRVRRGDGRQHAAGIRCIDQVGYRALRQDAARRRRRGELGRGHARHGAGEAADAAHHARAGDSDARRGGDPGRDCGLRRVPHRSPCRRRRAARSQAADRAGPRDRRARCGDRRGRDRGRDRRARRRALARLHLRRLSLLHERAREPVRSAAVHRLHPRRRLRDPRARRCALLLPAAGTVDDAGSRHSYAPA